MDIYIEYAKTRQQITALTNKMRELEASIISEIKDLSAPMKNEYGTYTSVTRVSIKLSAEAVEAQNKIREEIKSKTEPLALKIQQISEPLLVKVKEIEQKDIDSGKATKEEIVGLRFTEVKPK
jgi:BMFP domain-containing protein YqiC